MSDLISRQVLYEKVTDLEARALDYVGKLIERDGDEPSEEWKIWSAILTERTAFKHDVIDAAAVADPKMLDDGTLVIEVPDATVVKRVLVGDGRHWGDLYYPGDEPQWIPCNEILPEDNVPVNITWINRHPESYYENIKDVPFTATGVYFKGKWYWYSSTVEDYLAEYGRAEWDEIEETMAGCIEVTAWKPLPEPWKGADDE